MKKNNPFKMWGSWVGIITALLVPSYFYFKSQIDGVIYHMPSFSEYLKIIFYSLTFKTEGMLGNFSSIIIYILIVIGFLIGWGINVWWRKR